MSFILDALRKSESERQRDASPNPARVPLAQARRSTPVWVWLVIVIMAVALVVLSTAWLQRGTEPAAPLAEPVATPAPLPGPESVTAPAAAEPIAGAGLAEAEPLDPTPRPISELALTEPGLPTYQLELLAFNGNDPTRGYAWINGQRYFQGDRIGNGPELSEIRADSVLLVYRGRTYLLRAR